MSIDVVFLPGFLCDERLFAGQIDVIRDHPDIASVAVADLTQVASIESMAASVLERAPERFVAIGLSMGAIVAAEIAHTSPGRLAGIAVLDTNLAPPDAEQTGRRRAWGERVRRGELFDVVVDDLVEPLTHDVAATSALIIDMATKSGADTFVRQNEALLHRRDRRDDLAALASPVLIVCGRDDALCPPDVHHDVAARTPRAELVVVEAAGHLSTIDQPEAVSEILGAWLTRCEKYQQQPVGGETHEYTTT